jgi:uncharacterized protein
MNHMDGLRAYKIKDYAKALEIWEEEASEGNDQAMANIGLMYLKGQGVTKDFVKARKCFEQASAYDNDSANYNLALIYQTSIGVKEDLDKAIEYFRKAAKNNHQQANFRLALLLLKDRTQEELVKEGFECMLNAALSGHPMAKMQINGMDKNSNSTCKKNEAFRTKSKEEQMEVVKDALERYIRPILVKDGGNIMLIDFMNSPDVQVRLAYQGSCAGCSLASTSTYELIKDTLSKVIDEDIKVYII